MENTNKSEPIEKIFTKWTMYDLEKIFKLKQKRSDKSLNGLINTEIKLSDFEIKNLNYFKNLLFEQGATWLEIDLIAKFIGPLISFVNYDTDEFHYFGERKISAKIDNYILKGEPDGMVATGRWKPEIPFFFICEYKKEIEPPNDPRAQNLAAMLVAQELNNKNYPVYGVYIIGHKWTFMSLNENMYSFSKAYIADQEDIFDIFKILKHLKLIVIERIKLLNN